jgi:hypothetical protein
MSTSCFGGGGRLGRYSGCSSVRDDSIRLDAYRVSPASLPVCPCSSSGAGVRPLGVQEAAFLSFAKGGSAANARCSRMNALSGDEGARQITRVSGLAGSGEEGPRPRLGQLPPWQGCRDRMLETFCKQHDELQSAYSPMGGGCSGFDSQKEIEGGCRLSRTHRQTLSGRSPAFECSSSAR